MVTVKIGGRWECGWIEKEKISDKRASCNLYKNQFLALRPLFRSLSKQSTKWDRHQDPRIRIEH